MTDNKISVIIPVYNVEKYLSRCIDSIINQTYKNIEIILVDDGSVDKSVQICDEYADKYENICVIHKKNGGVSSARNVGLEFANGKYVAFVDADDYVSENMYEDLVNKIDHNNADISVCSVYQVRNDNEILLTYSDNDSDKDMMLKIMCGYGEWIFNKLYKRELIGNLRFDEELIFGEDVYWLSQYCVKCQKGVYSTDSSYYYFSNEQSACNDVLSKDKLINKYNMERKSHLMIFEVYKNAGKRARIEFEHFMVSINVQNFIKIMKNGWVDNSHVYEIKSLCRNHVWGLIKSRTSLKMKILCVLICINPKVLNHVLKQ